MDERSRQIELLHTPVGEEWSGRTRYGAATWFYEHGEMTADVLEVYRTVCRLDAQDPIPVILERCGPSIWTAGGGAKPAVLRGKG
jgi:hypothetical protein